MNTNLKATLSIIIAAVLGVTIVATPLMLQLPADGVVTERGAGEKAFAPQAEGEPMRAAPPTPQLQAQASLLNLAPILLLGCVAAFTVFLLTRRHIQKV